MEIAGGRSRIRGDASNAYQAARGGSPRIPDIRSTRISIEPARVGLRGRIDVFALIPNNWQGGAEGNRTCDLIVQRRYGIEIQPHIEEHPIAIRATHAEIVHGICCAIDYQARRTDDAACLILLGERPGLGAADSLGAYFTYAPHPGLTDVARNCVSNIRTDGLPPADAAHKLFHLMTQSLQRGLSGVELKDDSPLLRTASATLSSPPQPAL